MSVAKGRLVVDSRRKHLRTLVHHLLRDEGVTVRVFDAAGRPVIDAPPCDPGPPSAETECRKFLERSCFDRLRDLPDAEKAPEPVRCLTCPRGRNVQVLPILRSSVYFGTLVACGASPAADSAPASGGAVLDAMLDILAEDSSKEYEIDSLAGELALRYEEIELLYEIDEHIPLRSYTSGVIEYVADKTFTVIECSCLAWVPAPGVNPDAAGCRVFWKPGAPEPQALIRLEAEQLARTLALRTQRAAQPLSLPTLDNDPELRAFAAELNTVLSLPLQVEGDYYGSLIAFRPRGVPFTSYDFKLLTAIARKSAFVMRHTRLYEDLDSLFFNLIKLLINTIESKDEYTKGHSQRVRNFTVRLAELMSLPAAEIDVLNISGLLHDIGKQGIPDAILKKEGRLTEQERAIINTHPARGVDLIKHIQQFEKGLPHILHHHERIDGAGYPNGLQGEEIPLGARIIAVADTYDALTSDRCYRPRFTVEEAFDIIRTVTGTQLDPDVARVLLEHREEFALKCQQRPGPAHDTSPQL